MRKIAFILTAALLLSATACTNSGKKDNNNQELVTETFTNSNGETLSATYTDETVTLNFNGETIVLQQQPSGSGIRYVNDIYEYTEWQNEVELKKNGTVIFALKEQEPGMTENFVNADGKTLTVTYNTEGETPTATITYEEYTDQVLTQIPESASAKGAEYKNETMKWATNADGGVLTINGKNISFKVQE